MKKNIHSLTGQAALSEKRVIRNFAEHMTNQTFEKFYGRQLTKMIIAEVFTYAFSSCIIGYAIVLPLNRLIFQRFITAYFGKVWHVPVKMLIIILLVMFGAAAVAVHALAKRMRNMAVTKTINEL